MDADGSCEAEIDLPVFSLLQINVSTLDLPFNLVTITQIITTSEGKKHNVLRTSYIF